MTALHFDKVTKVYNGAEERAVDALTMHIKDGEIVALLGSSGCGKTTSLRMVAELETITKGEIRIGDRLVNALRPSERNVAMAFETYALYPPLRVRENIAFGLLRDRVAHAEIEKKVKHIAGMLEITDLLERFPAVDFRRRAAAGEPRSRADPQRRGPLAGRADVAARAAVARPAARPHQGLPYRAEDDDGGRDS